MFPSRKSVFTRSSHGINYHRHQPVQRSRPSFQYGSSDFLEKTKANTKDYRVFTPLHCTQYRNTHSIRHTESFTTCTLVRSSNKVPGLSPHLLLPWQSVLYLPPSPFSLSPWVTGLWLKWPKVKFTSSTPLQQTHTPTICASWLWFNGDKQSPLSP